jgi:hypothetical protein
MNRVCWVELYVEWWRMSGSRGWTQDHAETSAIESQCKQVAQATGQLGTKAALPKVVGRVAEEAAGLVTQAHSRSCSARRQSGRIVRCSERIVTSIVTALSTTAHWASVETAALLSKRSVLVSPYTRRSPASRSHSRVDCLGTDRPQPVVVIHRDGGAPADGLPVCPLAKCLQVCALANLAVVCALVLRCLATLDAREIPLLQRKGRGAS